LHKSLGVLVILLAVCAYEFIAGTNEIAITNKKMRIVLLLFILICFI